MPGSSTLLQTSTLDRHRAVRKGWPQNPPRWPALPSSSGRRGLSVVRREHARAQREEHHVVHAPPRPGNSRLCRPGLLLALGLMLVACRSTEPPARAAVFQRVPADPALAQVYSASCKLCHANPASGAPLTGDAAAWAPRLAQGIDTLLDHSINGYKGCHPWACACVLGRTVPGFDRFHVRSAGPIGDTGMPSHLSRRQLLQRAGALGAFAAMVGNPALAELSAHRA